MNKTLLVSLITLFLFAGCKPKQNITETSVEDYPFDFLDSTAAAKAIITDTSDLYFERVTPIDMSIQMKRPMNGVEDREQILSYYLPFLQTEVMDFTDTEKAALNKIMIRALNLCNSLSSNLVPVKVNLIKTRGNHYGSGAFYTRENCIVFPESDLKNITEYDLLPVILHELSHIITRYKPDLRQELYNTIGFKKIISDESKLIIPDSLNYRLLGNPDGLNRQYAIRLVKPNGKLIWALPLVYSDYDNFTPDIRVFFGYLRFQLFELESKESGAFEVITKPDGQSTLHLQDFPGFFEKIGDNTEYIIHPDEIIADNFYMMILASNETAGFSMNKFSKEGRKLIQKIKTVVLEH